MHFFIYSLMQEDEFYLKNYLVIHLTPEFKWISIVKRCKIKKTFRYK